MPDFVINSGGLGETGAGMSLAEASGTATTGFPSYCGWLPFADFLSQCQIPTQAQIVTANLSNYGANIPPSAVSATQAEIGSMLQSDCSANPDACSQSTFAANNPTTAALFGASTTGQAVGGLEDAINTLAGLFSNQWVWFGAAAFAAYLLVEK